jgi:hypothetical protein
LDSAKLSYPGSYSGISKDRYPRHVGRNLFEKFEPFRTLPYSNKTKPVALPPGRAKLSTKPAPKKAMSALPPIADISTSEVIMALPLGRLTRERPESEDTMLKTTLCEVLGIEVPIILAAMGGTASSGEFAAAVYPIKEGWAVSGRSSAPLLQSRATSTSRGN